MALKRVPNAKVVPEESIPSWLSRQIGSAAYQAAQVPSTIFQALENLGSLPGIAAVKAAEAITGKDLGFGKVAQSPAVQQYLMKGGLTEQIEPFVPQQFKEEPRNLGEFFLQRGLSQLPFAAAAAPQQLGQAALRTGIGSAAATAAKGAELGPLGQAIAQGVTEAGFGRLTRPTLGQKAAAAYEPIKPIGRYGNVSTKSLEEPLKKIEYLYDKQTSSANRNLLKDVYEVINPSRQSGKADLRDLWEMRTSLGKDWVKFKKAGFEPVMTDLRQGINEAIKGAEAKMINPKWWDSLTEGDKLKVADNIKTTIGEFVDSLPAKLLKKAPVLSWVPIALDKSEYLARAMFNPTARKHYFKLATAAAEGSKSDAIKYANQLEKILTKQEPEQRRKLKLVVNARLSPTENIISESNK